MLIGRITDRAVRNNYTKKSNVEVEMDLTQCHANGCPLDFNKLLAASDFDFNHDIAGIEVKLDRKTGKLKDGFAPLARKSF